MDINKLKSLVSSPTWQLFEEYLEDEQKMSVKRAMNSTEDKNIQSSRKICFDRTNPKHQKNNT
jgi:hypothetical protein